ncbi:MAG TPA: hypothetical protein VNZ03_20740 [Terriglobales bacterium]|jgi:hypothetical protein|nr:hypothetical protein [Terriglobales bacterium]
MKAETARLIADELEKAFADIDLSFEQGIKELLAMTERDMAIWKNAEDKGKLESALAECLPEPSPLSLDARIEVIRKLPYLLRLIFEGRTRPIRGRRRELSLSKARVVCKDIGGLLGQGIALKDVLTRMTQRHDVSLRTIQRVWYGRDKPGSPFNLQQPDVEGEDLQFTIKVARQDPSIELILKRQEPQKKKKRK